MEVHRLYTQSDKFKNMYIATWTWWWRSHPASLSGNNFPL